MLDAPGEWGVLLRRARVGGPSLAASGFSLKFISGKYQGGEFSLPDGGEITIGRASDLEMVLIEDMVSRKHARISCRGAEVLLQDLGSTNGTFVNGERIQKVRLRSGDRILVGTSILKLIDRTAGAYSEMTSLEQAQRGEQPAARGSALAGRLEDITLPELLQLFSASRKDGVLVLRGRRHRARILLEEGRIVGCSIADRERLDPRKAFYRLLTWTEGSFELQKEAGERLGTPIAESTEALLMEGVRQLDELRHIEAELPRPDEVLLLQHPILPPLRSLTPELLDTLQIVHNFGRVEAVLDQSAASDLDTYQELLYLLTNRYLRRA